MGIHDVETHTKANNEPTFVLSKNVGSILRLFLAIMVFVVFVLTISK